MNDDTRRSIADDGSAPPNRPSWTERVIGPDGHIAAETLSAYLDTPADFDRDELRVIEAHLETCADCSTTLAQLRELVASLHSLPQIEPSRSFVLTPELVGNRRSSHPRAPIALSERRPWYEAALPTLRWATAVAAILFVFVVAADIISDLGTGVEEQAGDVVSSTEQEVAESGGAAQDEAADTDAAAVAPAAATAEAATESAALEAAGASATDATTMSRAAPATPEAGEATGDQATGGAAVEETPVLEAFQQDEPADQSRQAADEQVSAPAVDRESSSERWFRIVEIGLAMLIILLLTALIALPRLRSDSRW